MVQSRETPEDVVVPEDTLRLKRIETQLCLMTKVFMDGADPIVIRDLQGHVLDVNHEFERVLGWRRDELIGGRTIHLVSDECQESIEEVYRRRLSGETVRNFETTIRTKSDRLVSVLVTGFLLTDENNEPVGMADILKDVTPLKQAREKLERRNRDLNDFARALSHDLASPLVTIRGFTETLLQTHQEQLDEAGRECCRSILESVNRMDRMIDDLLDLATLERDVGGFAPVDTRKALDDALANLAAAIRENAAEVTCGPLPTVLGNASLLSRVFQNLIGNAIKFRSHEAPRIHVSAEPREGGWQFSVEDNGIGIDPEYHDRVFAPFRRLHSADVFPGTGIGLTACRSIVERHGGRIWVESEKGHGSIFHFTIPDQPTETK